MTLDALLLLEFHRRHESVLFRLHYLHRLEVRLSLRLLNLAQIQEDVICLIKHLIKPALILFLPGYFILGAKVTLFADAHWPIAVRFAGDENLVKPAEGLVDDLVDFALGQLQRRLVHQRSVRNRGLGREPRDARLKLALEDAFHRPLDQTILLVSRQPAEVGAVIRLI